MRIQLDNQTHYRNDDLRAFIRGALKAVCFPSKLRKQLTVEVVHTRNSPFVSGWAWLGSYQRPAGKMRIRIPKTDPDLGSVARVLHHEVMHLVGTRHTDMTEEQRRCTGPVPDWAKDLPLRIKPKPDPQEKRKAAFETKLSHTEAMHKKALTRLKRAATIEKKWRRRLKQLQRHHTEHPDGESS